MNLLYKIIRKLEWNYGIHITPDKLFLEAIYYCAFNRKLNLNNVHTFNEKLQWLKLNDRNPKYTNLVDKYEAKEIVKNIIGEEYIIPTLGVWDSFNEINFDVLPNSFVLKCTHDSGGIVICKDKSTFNKQFAKVKLEKSLRNNFYFVGREWPYKNIKPRIIAEKYLDEDDGNLKDYKIMCFSGNVKCSFVCTNRFLNDGLKVTFFDREWNVLPFERGHPKSKVVIEKPINYELMVSLSEKLSIDIPFVRVDFYEYKKKVYFGELTFYPGSGLEAFTPSKWDDILGSWIDIALEDKKYG